MIVCAYGGGTNSTAMLVEIALNRHELTPDLILFSDTGGEKPHTIEYVETFSNWLQDNNMPPVVTVRAPNKTLEQDCLDRKALPSVAYGFKTCSQRWKIQPQNKFMNNWDEAKEIWKNGGKIQKLIGYDADEPQRAKDFNDDKYWVSYPLIEWDWGREECLQRIKSAGLPPCGKSACFFCPSSRPSEIEELQRLYPNLAQRCIEMEANAELTAVKGLGRSWSWTDLFNQEKLFDDSECSIEAPCGCYDG